MIDSFAAAIAAAKQADPMSNGDMATIPGRLLLADGDGLCYYCAGNDETSPGTARKNLVDKLRSAARACGAETIKVLLTGRGSHKGHRYAVARVKPYQGQRSGDRRPKNWEYLREVLEQSALDDIDVEITVIAEADDLFGRYAMNHPDCVIYTQDKDMRMVPGWHLDWLTHLMFRLEPGEWSVWHNEKQFGRAWFWSQMLHGDGADNIPGLPFYTDGSKLVSGPKKGQIKEIRCGEKSEAVCKLLPKVSSDMGALLLLQGLYRTCYGDRWLVEMLEQGILLWMRNDQGSSPFNVASKGNPFHALTTHEQWPAARTEILIRIAEGTVHEEAEDGGDCRGEGAPAESPVREVRPVPATVQQPTGSAGPRPLDGAVPSNPAPVVQCAAGQGGEQLPPVRPAIPAGVPSWRSRLSAKA